MPTQKQRELFLRVQQGKYDEVKQLLNENTINLNFIIEHTTLLHEAARNANQAIVELLLERGMDREIVDEYGWTAETVLEEYTQDQDLLPDQYTGIFALLVPPEPQHVAHVPILVGGCGGF